MAEDTGNPNSILTESANIAAQATKQMEKAREVAEALFQQSVKTTGKQSEAMNKMALIYDKVAKQQAELVKINDELNVLEKKRLKLLEEEAELIDKAKSDDKEISKQAALQLEIKKKDIELVRQDVVMKRSAAVDAKKASNEQLKQVEALSKQQGVMGKMFELGKSSMVQYIAGVASVSAAIANLGKLTQDVLDVSVLSGNYRALSGGFMDVVGSAITFQKGMAEARIGLRFLGYSTEEINQSYKELSVTLSMGGKTMLQVASQAAKTAESTGMLARVLGVTLPEATQYMIDMNQRFNQTTEQSAAALLQVYESTKKYNNEAGRTVIIGRDVTRVMFDLARETKGAAVDQDYLSRTLTRNLLQLQSQGRNYREALESSSVYIKKLSTDAPDWTKILAGRELSKSLGTNLSQEMIGRLEAARPGLAKRVQSILKDTKDEFTKQQLLQEALGSTQIGFEAMEQGVGQIIDRMGSKANIALKEIYGISQTEADSLIKQVNLSRTLKKEKEDMLAIDKMSGDARNEAVKKFAEENGIAKDYADILIKNQDAEQIANVLRTTGNMKAAKEVKATEAANQEALNKRMEGLRKQIAATQSKDTRKLLADQLGELEGTATKDRAGGDLSAVQGGKGGEYVATLIEIFKNPLTQFAAGTIILTSQLAIQTAILARMGGLPGSKMIGDLVKSVTNKGGFSGGAGGVASRAGSAARGVGLSKLAMGGSVVAGGFAAYDTYQDSQDEYDKAKRGGATPEELAKIKNKGLAKTAGSGLIATGGAYGGAVAGAALGSVVPVVGTIVGGLIGAAIGGYLGQKGGEIAGEAAYNMMSDSGVKNTPAAGISQSALMAPGAGVMSGMPNGVSAVGGAGTAGSGSAKSGMATIVPGPQGANILLDLNLGQVLFPIAAAQGYNMGVMAKASGGPAGK